MDISAREVRISAHGLAVGMYVSRLDRPWLETPFPMHGLAIGSEDDVARLQRLCSHVWVDVLLGRAPDPRHLAPEAAPSPPGHEELARLRRTEWPVQVAFDAELREAGSAHAALEGAIAEVMADLQQGRRLNLERLQAGVDAMVDSILRNPSAFVWLKEMKRRDAYAYQHAMGCAIWAANFGRHLGLERAELQTLALGGLLSDVGKTRLPGDLLARTGPLTLAEAELVRQHVQHSLEIAAHTPGLSPQIVEIIATHHERHDGSGYPHGLKGGQIPIFGRIMGVVDSYDAMTSVRPYAKSRSPHESVNELYQQRGRLFQAELVEQFIQNCGIYPTGTLVELSNGQVAVITDVHSLKRLRPRVMLLLDADKLPLEQFRQLDLGEVEHDDEGQPLTVTRGLPAGAYGLDPVELFLA